MGIGVEFAIQRDTIVVVSPVAGGPSEKLGIQAGDRLLQADTLPLAGIGITNDRVMKALRGPAGSKVTVKVLRGSNVEAGKSLVVEYFNSGLDWIELATLVSDGVAQSEFVSYEWPLPANASHDRFRLRFRPVGTDSSDTWFIDDVRVSTAPACPADLNSDGAVTAVDLSTVLANWGGSGSGDIDGNDTVDGIDLAIVLAAWGPCP